MKTKNYEIYFTGFISWSYRWTFLFQLELESLSKNYTEINLSVLCFNIGLSIVSDKWAESWGPDQNLNETGMPVR